MKVMRIGSKLICIVCIHTECALTAIRIECTFSQSTSIGGLKANCIITGINAGIRYSCLQKDFPQLCEMFVKVRELFTKVRKHLIKVREHFVKVHLHVTLQHTLVKHVHEPFVNVHEPFANVHQLFAIVRESFTNACE